MSPVFAPAAFPTLPIGGAPQAQPAILPVTALLPTERTQLPMDATGQRGGVGISPPGSAPGSPQRKRPASRGEDVEG